MVPKTETTQDVSPIETPVAFHPRGKRKLQPTVAMLCDLIDFVSQNETHLLLTVGASCARDLSTCQLWRDTALDDLLDIVGEENHPLAPLLHFVGTLIKNYEDEHVPKLTEL